MFSRQRIGKRLSDNRDFERRIEPLDGAERLAQQLAQLARCTASAFSVLLVFLNLFTGQHFTALTLTAS